MLPGAQDMLHIPGTVLALTSSAAECLVPGQRSHSTSQPSMAPGQFTGPKVPGGHLASPASLSRSQVLVTIVGFFLVQTKVNLTLRPGELHPIPLGKSAPANETT